MAKPAMVNFRLRDEDVAKIDAAAERLGVSRSDFIRDAVTAKLAGFTDDSEVSKVGVRGKAKEATVALHPDCPKSQYCRFVLGPQRKRICAVCGHTP